MRKHTITTFLSRKSMITRLSIAFEDFLGSSIAPQVMPPWMSLSFTSRVCTLRLLECWHFDWLLSCGITCTDDQCAKVARPRAFSRTSTSRQEQSRRKGLVQYCAGTKTKMTRFRIVQPQQLHYNETAEQRRNENNEDDRVDLAIARSLAPSLPSCWVQRSEGCWSSPHWGWGAQPTW